MAHFQPEHASGNENEDDALSDIIDPEFLTEEDSPKWVTKELEAHIEWESFKNCFAKAIVNFQMLETAIKDAIVFLVNENDARVGRIMAHRVSFPHLLKKAMRPS